jgi:hypothetical protein
MVAGKFITSILDLAKEFISICRGSRRFSCVKKLIKTFIFNELSLGYGPDERRGHI